MSRALLTLLLAGTLVGPPAAAQRTIVVSSGAPSVVLDARAGPPDPANPETLRVAMDSGNLGPGLEERWTAFQFTLAQAASFDGIEINYTEIPTNLPTTYGWAIYTDLLGAPGLFLSGGTGSYGALAATATSRTCANGFFVDRVATAPLGGVVSLVPGVYWAVVYGEDGTIPQFVGAPGGSARNVASRKTGFGSAYQDWETKLFAMPSFGAIITRGYDGLGSGPPYNYSGWMANEQQGRDLYHIAYSLVDTSGQAGSTVSGRIELFGSSQPPTYYFKNDTSELQAFDVCFCLPLTNIPQIVQTVNLDATGRFMTEKVRNGVYDVIIYPRHWYIGRFTCSDGVNEYQQPLVTGMGHPYVPLRVSDVVVTGGAIDLGTLQLRVGDVTLSADVDIRDVNELLVVFGDDVTDGCPPDWNSYRVTDDCDSDGDIDLFDVNAVLGSFGVSGPTR